MLVSSYHGGVGMLISSKIQTSVNILFVEDIIDTGKTLKSLKEGFEGRQPASVKIATLLDKPEDTWLGQSELHLLQAALWAMV